MGFISFVFVLITVSDACVPDPVVNISQGAVKGLWAEDGSYSMYLGIPYAMVDPFNPFGESLSAPVFDYIFDADDDSTMCPQVEEFNNTVAGILDCLDLNIYVPSTASENNPVPVMVWIYGGAFQIGFAGRYVHGPQYLIKHNVILVTVNYRVGIYGFMCLDTPSVPGNAGLKDQRKALRWVNENISAFGGDVNSITLFGESAGAYSVEVQILSPGSAGLFHNAILQSGTIFLHNALSRGRTTAAIELAAFLGHNAITSEEAIVFLRDVPAHDVVTGGILLGLSLGPCIEQTFDGVDNILTDLPENIFEEGKFQNIPLMIGYNNYESLIPHYLNRYNELYFQAMQDIVYTTLSGNFNFPTETELRSISKLIHEFYFGTSGINSDTIFNLIDFDSDWVFTTPIEKSIKHHLQKDTPVYQYIFAYSGDINFVKRRFNVTVRGATHADEIAFLFKQSYLRKQNSAADQLIIDRMTAMWTNFAKYRNPTPETTKLLPLRWPLASEHRSYMLIDSELSVHKKPLQRRMALWDLVYEGYNQYYTSENTKVGTSRYS